MGSAQTRELQQQRVPRLSHGEFRSQFFFSSFVRFTALAALSDFIAGKLFAADQPILTRHKTSLRESLRSAYPVAIEPTLTAFSSDSDLVRSRFGPTHRSETGHSGRLTQGSDQPKHGCCYCSLWSGGALADGQSFPRVQFAVSAAAQGDRRKART